MSKSPAGLRGRWIYYPRAELYVGYYSHRGRTYALAVLTRSSRYRTASGAGVGTTLEQLRKLPGVSCDGDGFTHGVLTHPSPNPGDCNHDPANRNHPFTWFVIDAVTRRVTQVAIVPGGD